MKKKNIIVIAVIPILAAAFVLADYFSLFGTSEKQVLDFAEIQFKPIDEVTGAPIYDTHAKCFRHRNHNACTIRDIGRGDIVSVHFPMYKTIGRSLFFNQSEEIDMLIDGDINIMLIHNDYHSQRNQYDLKDIYLNSGRLVSIKMKAKEWPQSDETREEP